MARRFYEDNQTPFKRDISRTFFFSLIPIGQVLVRDAALQYMHLGHCHTVVLLIRAIDNPHCYPKLPHEPHIPIRANTRPHWFPARKFHISLLITLA